MVMAYKFHTTSNPYRPKNSDQGHSFKLKRECTTSGTVCQGELNDKDTEFICFSSRRSFITQIYWSLKAENHFDYRCSSFSLGNKRNTNIPQILPLAGF